MLLQVRSHFFIPARRPMNRSSSAYRHSAITPLRIRSSHSDERPGDSIPIARAASRRFSPIHF